jgi:hypothetical protein
MDTIMYQVIKTGDDHTITYKGNGGTIPITTPKASRCPKNNIADFTVYKIPRHPRRTYCAAKYNTAKA